MKQFLIVLFFLIYCTGCVTTRLDPYSSPAPVERLKTLEKHDTLVTVYPDINEALQDPLGHQYLLFAIPFGSIYLTTPLEHIKHSIETALVEVSPRFRRNIKEINVRHVSARITAYDLFFMRRIVCTVTIELDNGTIGFGTESLCHPMPFKSVLERALNKATLSASREIISSSTNSH
jgi:hypothetical protein